jgi:MFS family permease
VTDRRAFAALAPVYASVFLYAAGTNAFQVLIPVYMSRSAGLGPTALGLVVGVFGVASLAARLPVGAAYSSARGRLFLVAGGAIATAAFLLIPLVVQPVVLALLMGLSGVGWSVATTAQLALLVGRPPRGISTAAAMGWFAGATALGNTVAGALGGATADVIGVRPTFIVLAATPFLGTLLMVRRLGGHAAGAPATRPEKRVWRSLAGMSIAVWAGVLVMFFINGLSALTNTFHPVLALASGLTLTQIGVLSSLRSWSSSSTRFGSGPVFSRFDPAGLTLPLVVLGAVATAFIPAVRTSFALQIPLFLAVGVSRGLLRVTGTADAFESVGADERRHGLTAAVLYGGLDLGKIVAPVVGGVVAGAFGISAMFVIVPLGFLALYLALALPARRALRVARAGAVGRASGLPGEP